MNVDMRSGRLNFKDINDLGVAGRASRFYMVTLRVFHQPEALVDHLGTLRTRVWPFLVFQRPMLKYFSDYTQHCRGKGSLSRLSILQNQKSCPARCGVLSCYFLFAISYLEQI
jgi:hypothetical protein